MDLNLLIALFSYLSHIVYGQCYIAGNVKWNATGKGLTEAQVEQKYTHISREFRSGGAFSAIRFATLNGNRVVIKLEDPRAEVCYLPLEVTVYQHLQRIDPNLLSRGFANMFDYAVYKGKFALIISQFGLDLINYSYKYKMGYKGETWRHIALNAISNLEFLHYAGWIHRDIKPENLIFGLERQNQIPPELVGQVSYRDRLYIIDLGGATRYVDANGYLYNQTRALTGTIYTPPFYSRTFRKGLSQSRRDDMETLGYALLATGGVKLPWDGCKNETKITEEQNRLCDGLEVVSICRQSEIVDKDIQAAFSTYFFLLKNLFTAKDGFYKTPDYEAFKKCFRDDPKAYYFNVTGKEFTESIVRKLSRRSAMILRTMALAGRRIEDRDLPSQVY